MPELPRVDPLPADFVQFTIATEVWREYDFGGRVYRINNPKLLVFRRGGKTHRVVDSNDIVHCVPAPGILGCVVRWKSIDPTKPVAF